MSEGVLSAEAGDALIRVARRALEHHFDHRRPARVDRVPVAPGSVGGLFVSLRLDSSLRGCIGYVRADLDLGRAATRAAVAAATEDPRFPPLPRAELEAIELRLSVLGPVRPAAVPEEIEPGRHGVIVERSGRRGPLLPAVAGERGWDRERFLAEASRKAGLTESAWRAPDAVLYRFVAEEFFEHSRDRT